MAMRFRLIPAVLIILCIWLAPGVPADRAQSAQPAAAPPAQNAPQATPDQGASIRQNVNLVDVLFTVFNQRNKIVSDLEKENFKVFDDNVPQEIRFFNRQTDLPLRVGLLLDTSNSIRARLQFEQEAATDFLFNVIRRDKDQAFLMSVDDSPEVIQPFTNDLQHLRDVVMRQRAGGGTALYDAVYQGCQELLRSPAPVPAAATVPDVRRVLVVISDGDDNLSRHSRAEALDMAQRAGIVIYSISTSIDWIVTDQETNAAKSFDRKFQKTGGDSVLRQFSVDRSGRFIACTRETNVVPAQIAIIDAQRRELGTLVDLNPEFADLRLSPVERMEGMNAYGEEWFGHLLKPSGYQAGRKYPLVITTYRSGDYFLLGASGNENLIQLYAANGFVVLSFDIGRLRSRRPRDFADRLLDWKSPTESISEAIDILAKSGLVDPERVGIAGFSHGAEIVEYAISHTARFHAAVLSGPAARDPYFYLMGGATWHETFENWGLGGWPEGAAKSNWKELAASLNADHIQAPLLVNGSDSEYIASLALYTSLEQLKKPVDLFVYAHELHIKNQPTHRYEIYERNLDWFRFWLRDEEDPSPDKASQFKYWRQLRQESMRSSCPVSAPIKR